MRTLLPSSQLPRDEFQERPACFAHAAGGKCIFDGRQMLDQSSGQDEQAFDQANRFLLDAEYCGCTWNTPSGGYCPQMALLRTIRFIT